mgnify:CR=1 FL=1
MYGIINTLIKKLSRKHLVLIIFWRLFWLDLFPIRLITIVFWFDSNFLFLFSTEPSSFTPYAHRVMLFESFIESIWASITKCFLGWTYSNSLLLRVIHINLILMKSFSRKTCCHRFAGLNTCHNYCKYKDEYISPMWSHFHIEVHWLLNNWLDYKLL